MKKINQFLLFYFPLTLSHVRVKFPHSPILHYAFSSWIEKTMTKTIDCHWEDRFVSQQYGAVRKFYRYLPLFSHQPRNSYCKSRVRIKLALLNNNYKLKFTKLNLSTDLSPLQRPFFCTWLLFSGWLSLHDFFIFFYYLDSSHSLNIITTVFLGDLSTYKFAAILHEIQVTLSADVN